MKFNLKNLDNILGNLIFSSRWILYPMNVGLAVAGILYGTKFMMDLWTLLHHGLGMETEGVMLGVLGLVDMLMVANLVDMIYMGSHQIFIQRFVITDTTARPQWLDHVDSGILKVKMASSVGGIMIIRILKDFVNVEHTDWIFIQRRCYILGVALGTVLIMAVIWRLTHSPIEAPQHKEEQH
jgi:uncharacterized protein (TIGR00645 family)